jgi:hypothetical protein
LLTPPARGGNCVLRSVLLGELPLLQIGSCAEILTPAIYAK